MFRGQRVLFLPERGPQSLLDYLDSEKGVPGHAIGLSLNLIVLT